MSTLVIRDLADSVELDQLAMSAIRGGSRQRFVANALTLAPSPRFVVDYPPGFPQARQLEPVAQPVFDTRLSDRS